MTDWIWTRPTARKEHRCQMCFRKIMPGEDYDRMAGLDRSDAWTYKYCRHCYRVSQAWIRASGEDEWDEDWIFDWLSDEHPAIHQQAVARWRYPDGELLPLPFQRRCNDCRTGIPDDRIWCKPCDIKRIERLTAQFDALGREYA